MNITDIIGREILDSRGQPTVEVDIFLEDGAMGRATAPSGASKGTKEAVELRDNDSNRYNGKGIQAALEILNKKIKPSLLNHNAYDQMHIDKILLDLDNTMNKAALGANVMLATSLATAKAAANSCHLPLFRYIGGVHTHIMPMPLINIINGGAHADNLLDIQEFMIAPIGVDNFSEAMRISSEVFYALKALLKQKGYNTNYGDEGGFAPALDSNELALELITEACNKAGYVCGKDILIALDVAASHFYQNGKYIMKGVEFSTEKLMRHYEGLVQNFPVFSLEDPFAEDDIEGWVNITQALPKVQIVGDDIFVTNPVILAHAIQHNIANAILIKPNQIGTLTETLLTIELAKENKYKVIISHRSGETEDTTIAHLAVAVNASQIKAGSVTRSERLAKYNELFRISEDLGIEATYGGKYLCALGS